MLTGFSFTARVWGKLLLGDMKVPLTPSAAITTAELAMTTRQSVLRSAKVKMGVTGGLGGEGSCGSVATFAFKNKRATCSCEDKKKLIRAVAERGTGTNGTIPLPISG
jgi:hypothetical protein